MRSGEADALSEEAIRDYARPVALGVAVGVVFALIASSGSAASLLTSSALSIPGSILAFWWISGVKRNGGLDAPYATLLALLWSAPWLAFQYYGGFAPYTTIPARAIVLGVSFLAIYGALALLRTKLERYREGRNLRVFT